MEVGGCECLTKPKPVASKKDNKKDKAKWWAQKQHKQTQDVEGFRDLGFGRNWVTAMQSAEKNDTCSSQSQKRPKP